MDVVAREWLDRDASARAVVPDRSVLDAAAHHFAGRSQGVKRFVHVTVYRHLGPDWRPMPRRRAFHNHLDWIAANKPAGSGA